MLPLLIATLYFLATTDLCTPCFPTRSSTNIEYNYTGEFCNYNQGRILEIILKHDTNSVPKITICEDTAGQKAFWTRHTLSKTPSCDIDRSLDLLTEDLDVSESEEDFDLVFLTPICDFSNDEERQLTVHFLNVAPICKTLKRGNWRDLENFLRETINSDFSDTPVKIITGTFDYPVNADIFEISYPLFFFKVVVFEDVKFVYVAVNGEDTVDAEAICDVIPNCGWDDGGKGLIFCCNLDEAMNRRLGVEDKDLEY